MTLFRQKEGTVVVIVITAIAIIRRLCGDGSRVERGGGDGRGGRVVAPTNAIGAGNGGLLAAAVEEVVAPPKLPVVCGGGGRGCVRGGRGRRGARGGRGGHGGRVVAPANDIGAGNGGPAAVMAAPVDGGGGRGRGRGRGRGGRGGRGG